MVGYLFGGSTGETYESLQRRREAADMLAQQMRENQPKTALAGVGALLQGAVLGYRRYRDDKIESENRAAADSSTRDLIKRWMMGDQAGLIPGGNPTGANVIPPVAGTMQNARNADRASVANYAAAQPAPSGDIYNGFMDTVKTKVTNPYALAAIAATGKAESQFSPGNANRAWSDPSQSGQQDMAGGIMSWRGGRLGNLYKFASAKGEKPGAISPQTQAEFFLGENPQLTNALNNAKSVDEAQSLMNNAWRFAGYDRAGGESARRLGYANSLLPTFQNSALSPGQQAIQDIAPTQVASLDPNAGMDQQQPTNAQNTTLATAAMGNQPQQVQQPQQQVAQNTQPSIDKNAIMQALANPWVSRDQKQVLQMILEQQMQQEEAARQEQVWRSHQDYERQSKQSDPLYQLQLQEGQAQLDALKNPKDPEAVRALDYRARQAGLQPGTPEYQQFMLNGGKQETNSLVNAGNGALYDPRSKTWLQAPNAQTPKFDDVSGLRKEITNLPSYKNFTQALPIYKSMTDTAGRNTRASDLNLVYGLGKIMDPTSVVREGEMIMAKNTAGIPDWLIGAINSVNGGAALTPETRKAIMDEAYSRMTSYNDAFHIDTQMYGGIADRNKINRADVIPDFGQINPYTPPADTGNPDASLNGGRPFWGETGNQKTTVQPGAIPNGVDPNLWNSMTPDEQQQFFNAGRK